MERNADLTDTISELKVKKANSRMAWGHLSLLTVLLSIFFLSDQTGEHLCRQERNAAKRNRRTA
jgi:hypothetical protein